MVSFTKNTFFCLITVGALTNLAEAGNVNTSSEADTAQIQGGLREKAGEFLRPKRKGYSYELYSTCENSPDFTSFNQLHQKCNAEILKLTGKGAKKMFNDLRFKITSSCNNASLYTDMYSYEEDCQVSCDPITESLPNDLLERGMYQFSLHTTCKDAQDYEDFEKFDEECSFKVKKLKSKVNNNDDFGTNFGMQILNPSLFGSMDSLLASTSVDDCGKPEDYNNIQEFFDACIPDGIVRMNLGVGRI